jgi:hypothetical protein
MKAALGLELSAFEPFALFDRDFLGKSRDFFHQSEFAVAGGHAPRRFHPLGIALGDCLGQLIQPDIQGIDQSDDAPLLRWLVLGFDEHFGKILLNGLASRHVGIEVKSVTTEDEGAMTNFGLAERGQRALEGTKDLVGVVHFPFVGIEPNQIFVVDPGRDRENGKRRG